MSQELSRAQRTTIEWTLISTAILCTLFVWSPAADPVNLPKFVLLSLGASILAGLVLIQLAQSFRRFNRTQIPVLLLILFLLVLFISSMHHG